MGGGASKRRRQERYLAATEKPERLKKFTNQLEITDAEVEKAFNLYDKVDRDKSGEINIDEFFRLFQLDWSSFGKNIFSAMDVDGDNSVEFVEFFVGLWNYCTMEHDTMLKFAFDLFDVDGSGEIEKEEFKQLVSMIHGNKKMDSHAEKLMKLFDKDGSGTITFTEFLENEKKAPSLFREAFTLQRKMRTKCHGEAYWNNATKRRKKALPDGGDLIEFHYKLYHGESLNRKEKKDETQADRLGSISYKGMTSKSKVPYYKDPSKESKRVGKYKATEYVTIKEEMESGGSIWYKLQAVGESPEGWMQAKYVKIEDS